MKSAFARLGELWRRFRRSPWYRLTEGAVLAISLGLMVYALVSNVSRIDLTTLKFDIGPFAIAVILTWIAVWLGAAAWTQILKAIQPRLPESVGVESHMLSLATKYLPGVGWQQISKAVQITQKGLPAEQGASAIVLEFVMVLFTGVATAVQTLAFTQQNVFGINLSPFAKVLAPLAFFGGLVLLPMVCLRFSIGIQRSRRITLNYLLHMMSAGVIQAIGWIVFGIGLWFTSLSVFPVSTTSLPQFVVVLIYSFIAGIIVIFSPNGLGVRELAMSTALQSIIPLPASVIVSIMSRFALIMAEMLWAIPFVIAKYKHKTDDL